MSLQRHKSAVRRFERAMRFANWLQALPGRLTPPPFRLLQVGSAFWQSRALYVAARLDIATALAHDTLAAEEIARRVGAAASPTHRLLRMLAALGIFSEPSPGRFRNNKVSACLRTDAPQSVRSLVLMHNSPEMSRPWYEQLEQAVRGGEVPFQATHGEEMYAYMDSHPEFDALFTGAMESVEALTGEAYATDFDWGRFERIIDIGGSNGGKALAILKHHPALTALVVDRPQVVDGAEHRWQGRVDPSLLARLGFRPGDLFGTLPNACSERDIYFLSAVLHGFDDEQCVRALANLASASGTTGAPIAVLEMVVEERGADYAAASFDMQMFMGTRGRERTLGEWQHLFERSGLRLDEVVGLRSFGSILVLRTGTSR